MLLLSVAPAVAQDRPDAGALLQQARDSLATGDATTSLARLRDLRSRFPSSALVADALGLSVEASLYQDDVATARYFLDRLAELFPGSPAAFSPGMVLGDLCWSSQDWAGSLAAYRTAIAASVGLELAPADLDRALVRAADTELNRDKDEQAARLHWQAARPANLDAQELEIYRRLRMRLAWSRLTPGMLGLPDANISALAVDGDDLWVGTWNGGTARWSLSSGTTAAFPQPESPRAFQPVDRRVWVATFSGLAYYARGSGSWSLAELPGSKVQALAVVGGELYAGTLGDGLLRLRGDRWERVGDDEWPGAFITCLAPYAAGDGVDRLLVGTMNFGLLVLDLSGDSIRGLSESEPSFTPLNVTAVLADRRGRVWIGTYGEGLWLWDPGRADAGAAAEAPAVRRFGSDTAEIADDWVLSICETERGVWFGTFGGGASFRSDGGQWRTLGVAEGLPSLDVAAIAWRGPWVYFGTLGAGVAAYWEAADAR